MGENFRTYAKMWNNFNDAYLNKIVPRVRRFENERKRKLFVAIIQFLFFILLGILLMAIPLYDMLVNQRDTMSSIGIFSLLLFIGAFVVWSKIKKSFEKNLKEKIMPVVCDCLENIEWINGEYEGEEDIAESGVIPKFDLKTTYDDVFIGSYKDVKVDIAEGYYTKIMGRNAKTVFDGVIIKLDMNKNFSGHTIIKSGRIINFAPLNGMLKKTKLEDHEFNKKFDVFTNDEVDARYLLTPSFMERLKNVEIAFGARSISCAFYNKFLIIALYTEKDIFSVGSLIKRIDDPNPYYKMFEEILSIIKLIDHFKLNQKTGL